MKHVHRYQRTNIAKQQGKKYEVYRCSLPDCNHYLVPELVVGKKSVCWRCGETFILVADLARLAKPHCKACTKTEDPLPSIDLDFLRDLGIDLD